jgi:hypothetical protein
MTSLAAVPRTSLIGNLNSPKSQSSRVQVSCRACHGGSTGLQGAVLLLEVKIWYRACALCNIMEAGVSCRQWEMWY